MPSPTEAHLERLARALAALPQERASALVDEAWEQAADRVRETLATAMQAALLRGAVAILEAEQGDTPRDSISEPGDGEPSRAPSPAQEKAELVWYAYAVVDTEASAPVDEVEPMAPGAPVQVVRSGSLAALASRVPASEFGPEALQEQLYDQAWLGDAARRHDAALRQLLGMSAFVPLRFCTIVRTRDDLSRFLDEHASELRSALDVVAGRSEWGLKVSTDPERIREHLASASDEIRGLQEQINERAGGKAYFLDKRLTQLLEEEAEQLATREAGELHARLSHVAVDSQLLPLQRQSDGLAGSERMVLNGAYLVPDDGWEAFEQDVRSTAERWAALGLIAELTGPWPPYSFVDLDLAVDAAR